MNFITNVSRVKNNLVNFKTTTKQVMKTAKLYHLNEKFAKKETHYLLKFVSNRSVRINEGSAFKF